MFISNIFENLVQFFRSSYNDSHFNQTAIKISMHGKQISVKSLIFAIPLQIESNFSFDEIYIMSINISFNNFLIKRLIRKPTSLIRTSRI